MTLIVGTNSYLSLADAEAYFAARLRATAWASASDADKETALLQACRAIESLVPNWEGAPTVTGQALQWPRMEVPNRRTGGRTSGWPYDGYAYYDMTAMPQPLTDAQCEEALELLARAQDLDMDDAERDRARGVVKTSIAKASVEYGNVTVYGGVLVSAQAWQCLRPLRRTTPAQVRM